MMYLILNTAGYPTFIPKGLTYMSFLLNFLIMNPTEDDSLLNMPIELVQFLNSETFAARLFVLCMIFMGK